MAMKRLLSILILLLFRDFLDKSCRIAAHDGVRRDILGDYSSGCHNSVLAHSHTRQDGRPRANPSVSADSDRFADKQLTVIKVVVVAYQLDVGGYQHIVLDGYAAARHHQAVVHDDDVAADLHMVETNAGETGHHTRAVAYVAVEKLIYERIVFRSERHRLT